ncbi:hypothetical protein ADL15_09705 [Actinoplanes awajinensis subsp. mycoplanecinus]|uniref:Uncharacterized protein n=1 Tax=Actinoplanes awajinensis subsp. mycoplanecinus TaxID=135947 RepID=A0A0X3V403_9ACTN|nr:hypothetical protein ADL15_09705 [Actinoplanes awajinensis subsp. mycoplanecinus]
MVTRLTRLTVFLRTIGSLRSGNRDPGTIASEPDLAHAAGSGKIAVFAQDRRRGIRCSRWDCLAQQ